MIHPAGFYWAWDEDGNAQPVECLGNGNVLTFGVGGPVPENSFVHIDKNPIPPPADPARNGGGRAGGSLTNTGLTGGG
jgi:hypothetical protein